MNRRASRVSSWMAVAIAVAALFSHICVLPHAHADESVSAPIHQHDEDQGTIDDGLHGASCEVVRTAGTPYPVVTFTLAPLPFHVEAAAHDADRLPDPASRGPSPPLFLLHSALLI
jgi:hypothetical protein